MKILFSFLLFCSIAFSQNSSIISSEWKSYTDVKDIYSFVFQNNRIWAASNGGSFVLNTDSYESKIITNVNGLSTINLRSVCIDAKNRIWFGNSNGYIDVYDQVNDAWQHFPDIYLSNASSKKSINRMISHGDSVYIASEFGLSVYDIKKGDFQDSYFKFGNFPAFLSVSFIKIINNSIYVVTSSGLAIGDLNNKNLLSPDSWKTLVVNKENSTEVDEITSIEFYNNKVYISTKTGLVRYSNNILTRVYVMFSATDEIVKLYSSGNFLYIAGKYHIFKMNKLESKEYIFNVEDYITDFHVDSGGLIWYSLPVLGLKYYDLNNKILKRITFNCPNSNLFNSLAVDGNSRLWAASGIGMSGRGFYSMKNDQWMNFTVDKYPVLIGDQYYKVIIDKSGNPWIGSWGRGIAVVKNDSNVIVWNEKNSSLSGGVDPKWVTISSMAGDYDGNVWILNSYSNSGKPLVVFNAKDSSWNSYSNGLYPSDVLYQDITVDDIGTKWFISGTPGTSSNHPGIFYYNSIYDLPGAENKWGLVDLDKIAAGASLTCLTLDKTGELWIGTTNGLALIYNTRQPDTNPARPCYMYSNCNMSSQYINCIAVDALNNKWVGTQSSGIWVLSSDGSSIIAQLNTGNSKILSNNIKSIAIDNKTGTVYIGTLNGLSALKTILIEPVNKFSKTLKISPNPFIPGEKEVMIDGLVEGSQLKVITTGGKLVREFFSPGGRIAFWDGKDDNNNYVSSGIYFIIAFNPDGSEVSKGKIAVIKR